MSEKGGITHDTAARLIGVTPGALEAMVRDGIILREDRNRYTVPVLVQGYVEHLRGLLTEKETHPKQADTAAHVDLSDRSIREWEQKLGLQAKPYSLSEFRVAYIRALREEAAGRATAGDLDLATERARLAREQADKIAMQNAQARRELAPVVLITEVLAKAGTRVAGILEAIPGQVKRRLPDLPATEIEAIQREIAKARNVCAAIRLEDLDDEPVDDPDPIDEAA